MMRVPNSEEENLNKTVTDFLPNCHVPPVPQVSVS